MCIDVCVSIAYCVIKCMHNCAICTLMLDSVLIIHGICIAPRWLKTLVHADISSIKYCVELCDKFHM